MSVLQILTPAFVEALPDDPHDAFIEIVRAADLFVREEMERAQEIDSWHGVEAAQHSAMSAVIGGAKQYKIAPYDTMEVPTRRSFGSDLYSEFKLDLDHYVAQWILQRGLQVRRDAVPIPPEIKDKLRSYISGMKSLIDGASISDAKRAVLHKKLADFEAALEKDRLPIFLATGIIVGILAVSADVATLADSTAFAKLTSNIMMAIGSAKAADDENRKVPTVAAPLVALPPRQPKVREEFNVDLDDEIPF